MKVGDKDHRGRSFLGWLVRYCAGPLYFAGVANPAGVWQHRQGQGLLFQTKLEARAAIEYRLNLDPLYYYRFVKLYSRSPL